MTVLPLALSVGDPAGVGPALAFLAARELPDERLALYGDGAQLAELSARLGVVAPVVASASEVPDVGAAIIDVGPCPESVRRGHQPSAEGGRAQIAALHRAVLDVRRGAARALVTGPTSKAAAALAGIDFRGQTEHLARGAGLADDDVTMMFLDDRLRVALVTTHFALRDVPEQITARRVARATTHLGEAVIALGDVDPEVLVVGLNPHAGEDGLFGDEESRVIAPGIALAAGTPPFQTGRARVRGPIGAETVFRWAAAGEIAGVVAMYHDQATVPAKLLAWTTSVNVTWGLPFIRTSVDHGVAYDAARSFSIDASGMVSAIRMARRLTAG